MEPKLIVVVHLEMILSRAHYRYLILSHKGGSELWPPQLLLRSEERIIEILMIGSFAVDFVLDFRT